MYISIWCLLLASPRLEINLDLTTACLLYSNLKVVLVDYSITLSISYLLCVHGTWEKTNTVVLVPPPYLSVEVFVAL